MLWNEIEPKVNRLQDDLLTTMDKIECLAKEESQIPKPDSSFETAKTILKNREYDVVVCGEVKKGKSSFINAIIGQNILPVDSDIATSQVFRLSNSTDGQEHFSLRFTDGSNRNIQREELAEYGSQVEANENGVPDLEGKNIAYIQIQVPAAFLPAGVSIVDTPGLGALYKSHEYITQTYVGKAAAVIFMLDYERPIVEQEVKFINKVLDVTPCILFVITKSDLYEENVRKAIIARDEEIIAEIYEKRNLKASRIYPVSSSSLMGASQKRIEKLRKASLGASGFTEVETQLMKLIYRAMGLLRTDNALSVSVNYVNRVNKLIGDIVQSCKTESDSIVQQIEQDKRKLQEAFQYKWNANGAKRAEISNRINQICETFVIQANSLVSTTGDLYRAYIRKIERINSISSAASIGKNLPAEYISELNQRWKALGERFQCEIQSILASSDAEMSQMAYQSNIGFGANKTMGFSTSDYINIFKNSGGLFLPLTIINFAFNPASWAALIIAILAMLILGKDAVINKVKSKVNGQLSDLCSQGQSQVNQEARRLCSEIKNTANHILNDNFIAKKGEIQSELEDLQRRGQMQLEEKKREFQKWNGIKSQWDRVTESIRGLISERKEIVEILNS